MDMQATENQNLNIDNSADDAIISDIIQNMNLLIERFKSDNNIEDISTITQQQFTALLDYIRFNYFKPYKVILYKYKQGIANNGLITEMYNYYILSGIADYYIYLCRLYNKVSNIYGFSQLTGVGDDTICSWGKLESQRPEAFRVYKMLLSCYENGLENGAQNGKNPVGFIATLNHRFGWSADNKPQLTVNITRSRDEILSSVNPALLDDAGANT